MFRRLLSKLRFTKVTKNYTYMGTLSADNVFKSIQMKDMTSHGKGTGTSKEGINSASRAAR